MTIFVVSCCWLPPLFPVQHTACPCCSHVCPCVGPEQGHWLRGACEPRVGRGCQAEVPELREGTGVGGPMGWGRGTGSTPSLGLGFPICNWFKCSLPGSFVEDSLVFRKGRPPVNCSGLCPRNKVISSTQASLTRPMELKGLSLGAHRRVGD